MSGIVTERATVGAAAPREQRRNRFAIWSLVLAILTLGGIGSLFGIILGAKARAQIQREGGRGMGLAVAGIVVGVLTLILAVVYWVVIAQHVGGGGGSGGSGGGY